MKLAALAGATLLLGSVCTTIGAGPAAAAISPIDAAATLGRQFVSAIGGFSPSSAVSAIEAQLALVVEQSGVTDAAALQAIAIAEAAPNLPHNALDALEALKRLINSRKGQDRKSVV